MDIVERLRAAVYWKDCDEQSEWHSDVPFEAAAEIERLRGELAARDARIAELEQDVDDWYWSSKEERN